MTLTTQRERGSPLPEALRAALRVEVDRAGVPAVAAKIGIAPSAVARALAGLSILRGSAALIERGLS